MFSDNLEVLGFIGAFVTQNIYTVAILFDMLTDPNKMTKVITLPAVAQKYIGREINIPLYWFIAALAVSQYNELLNAILMIKQSYSRWGKLRISRDNRIRLDNYKAIFVAGIVFLFILTTVYMQYNQIPTASGTVQLLFTIAFIVGLTLTVLNNLSIYTISYQVKNTTDGFRVNR
jgi:hypothetical protein